jgi:hypothetical protein
MIVLNYLVLFSSWDGGSLSRPEKKDMRYPANNIENCALNGAQLTGIREDMRKDWEIFGIPVLAM